MRIEALSNICIDENFVLICPRSFGLQICNLIVEFDDYFNDFDKDHCECIKSSVEKREKKLLVTLITEKNDIDEFIVFRVFGNGKPVTAKLRFKR